MTEVTFTKERRRGTGRATHAGLTVLAALILGGLSAGAAGATDLELGKWVDKAKVSGDFRLRYDGIHYGVQNAGNVDRNQERFRLRVGLDLPVQNDVTVRTRFASGTGEQTSTNQSFDNLGSQKAFWIDRAYLEWKPMGGMFTLTGGRMANPLWNQYSSDIVWDDDYNPEGFGQKVDLLAGPVALFANAMQNVVDEDKTTNKDQWEFSEQVGAEFHMPWETRLRLAYAQHDWIHISTGTKFTVPADGTLGAVPPTKVQDGNRRNAAGVLLNDFHVHEVSANYSLWAFQVPVSLQLTYIVNTGVSDVYSSKQNKGYQWGTILGKAAAKNSVELAYFYKYSQSDATVADVADSDFGEGGTNRKGHIGWIAYNFQEWAQLKFKFFQTKTLEPSLTPGPKDINRFQTDLVYKF